VRALPPARGRAGARVIVCVCHGVTDRSLAAAAAAGLSIEEVARATGAGASCGSCAEAVACMLRGPTGCRSPGHRCPGCERERRIPDDRRPVEKGRPT